MTALALAGLATPLRKSRHQRTDRARCLSTRRTRYSSSCVERRLSSRLLQRYLPADVRYVGLDISTTLTSAAASEALAGTGACLPITFLALSLLVLLAVVVFGSWYMPAFGDAGLRLQHYLFQPLFSLGGLPITFFLFSQSRYLYYSGAGPRVSFHDALAAEESSYPICPLGWATIYRGKSDLVFSVYSRLVGLQYSEEKR